MSTSTQEPSQESLVRRILRPRRIQRPKRNKNNFIIFCAEIRPQLKKDLQLNSNQMMVKLADIWKNTSEEEKVYYDLLAEQDKQRYKDECDAFALKHPDIPLQNKTKKNHTKRPVSAYAAFLREMTTKFRNEKSEKLVMAEIIPKVAELWKKLSVEEIDHYQKLSSSINKLKDTSATTTIQKKGRRKSDELKRTSKTKDIPMPKKHVKNAQGSLNALNIISDVACENLRQDIIQIDSYLNFEEQISPLDDSRITTTYNVYNLKCEPLKLTMPDEKNFHIDDQDLLVTALQISKKQSWSCIEDLLRDDKFDLYEFLTNARHESQDESCFDLQESASNY